MIDILPAEKFGTIIDMVDEHLISRPTAKRLIGYYIAIGKLKKGIKLVEGDIEDLVWVLKHEKS